MAGNRVWVVQRSTGADVFEEIARSTMFTRKAFLDLASSFAPINSMYGREVYRIVEDEADAPSPTRR